MGDRRNMSCAGYERHEAPRVDVGRRTGRFAFTLVELLVVIAIIGALIALLLPAVQASRESGRRVACQNNMRQMGIAILGFESMRKVLPASGWTVAGPGNPAGKYVGWRALILPYVEETALHDLYDFNANWWEGVNLEVGTRELELFLCPSVPEHDLVLSAVPQPPRPAMTFSKPLAPTDYEAIMGVQRVVNPTLYATDATRRSAMFRNSQIQMGAIRDGATHTIFIVECGGRPAVYYRRNSDPTTKNNQGISWIDSEGGFSFDGADHSGKRQGCGPADCPVAINASNFNEPYSFHTGGANFLFGDGHVSVLLDDIKLEVFAAYCTRSGREVIPL